MISILVCSIKPDFAKQLQANVAETIGVAYELLIYDNREAGKGICAVYNNLAQRARFDNLCFVHEDVLFTARNWGKILIDHFSIDKYDVVGIAGSKYKSAMFSGWFTGQKDFDCANYVHQYPSGSEKVLLKPQPDKTIEEVVCLDGVFICCKKEVWRTILFNDALLKGFHFYDIDFTLRASGKYRVGVSYNIDLMHITKGGDFGNKWIDTAILFHLHYRHKLPFSKEYKKSVATEKLIAKANLDFLKSYRISIRNKLRWIYLQKLYRFADLYYSIAKFLIYEPLGLKYVHNTFKSK